MKTINLGDRVKYIGVTNNWTFEQDLTANTTGTVIDIFDSGGKTSYRVEFENGIKTTVDFVDLKIDTLVNF